MGVAVLGMFAGLLLGVLLAEPVGSDVSPGTALLLGLAPPVLAVLGAVAGVLIARRSR
jgi:hypothetical protein